MCKSCLNSNEINNLERRRFLVKSSLAGISLASGVLVPSYLSARETTEKKPRGFTLKQENVLSPEQALERAIKGNERYINGVMRRHDFINERESLIGGQNPYAAVLGCADSRIAPEYAFDSGRGDIFATRVAGNFANDDNLASLEYAIAVLNTPLIIVLGHERCGAVNAAIQYVQDKAVFPGSINKLAESIAPSVKKVLDTQKHEDLQNKVIVQNVKDVVQSLHTRSAILSDAVEKKKLRIVGGVYRLASGKIDFLI